MHELCSVSYKYLEDAEWVVTRHASEDGSVK
jgi:hypothetical protein